MVLITRPRMSISIACLAMAFAGCMQNYNAHSTGTDVGAKQKEIAYPYIASEERQQQIITKYQRVQPGMSEEDVISLLGEPDEKNATYEPKTKNPQPIGFSYVYLVQRMQDSGSVETIHERLIRVHFDQAGLVTRIISAGLGQ